MVKTITWRVPLLVLLALALAGCWNVGRVVSRNEIAHYREGTMESFTKADGLPTDRVTAIAVSPAEVWVGTNKGLAVFNRQTRQWAVHTRASTNGKLPSDEITALARDSRGRIWVGTAKKGVVRIGQLNWDLFDSNNELPGSIITCLYAEPSGLGLDDDNVWVGTTMGLARYNADGWAIYQAPSFFATLQDDSMLSDDVRCVGGDDAFVWCGSDKGVARYNDVNWKKWMPEGGFDLETMEFTGPDRYPIKEDEISCIAYDGREWLYIAARRAMIAAFDGASWRDVPLERGCDIKAMLAFPDGELWVSRYNSLESFADLRRLDPTSNQWQVLTTADGLPSNKVNCLVAEGRDLWIGTEKGLAHLTRPAAVPLPPRTGVRPNGSAEQPNNLPRPIITPDVPSERTTGDTVQR